MTKVGRNARCPCGSGAKYKRCCGNEQREGRSALDARAIVDLYEAKERIRQNQQGLGRPVISGVLKGHQIVAVGNTIHWSKKWKTFPEFLFDYWKRVMGPGWGKAELAKVPEARHPLMQWAEAYCDYQRATIKVPGQVTESVVTGVVACFLGVAYSLYLLEHNVELQDRLVKRLRDPGNFQGAYYELIIANILIRAGFTLALEDEADSGTKHCEFAAVSKQTGRRYWVEAKMRAETGLLGRTAADGSPAGGNPLSSFIRHLNGALAKPAADERLIFIDLNAERDDPTAGAPAWGDKVVKRLERYEEKELKAGSKGYVFVTNLAYHRCLDRVPVSVVLPYGLGIPDFNRPGHIGLAEAFRRKQRHIDAFRIAEMFPSFAKFPATFDGSLPSEAFGGSHNRVIIGETYLFPAPDGGWVAGKVTATSVDEVGSKVIIGIEGHDGRSALYQQLMSAAELADYRANRESYFGRVQQVSRKITDRFEFFEWLVEAHKKASRVELLDRYRDRPDFESVYRLTDQDLLLLYCELLIVGMGNARFDLNVA
jgi:hypothetical protein